MSVVCHKNWPLSLVLDLCKIGHQFSKFTRLLAIQLFQSLEYRLIWNCCFIINTWKGDINTHAFQPCKLYMRNSVCQHTEVKFRNRYQLTGLRLTKQRISALRALWCFKNIMESEQQQTCFTWICSRYCWVCTTQAGHRSWCSYSVKDAACWSGNCCWCQRNSSWSRRKNKKYQEWTHILPPGTKCSALF